MASFALLVTHPASAKTSRCFSAAEPRRALPSGSPSCCHPSCADGIVQLAGLLTLRVLLLSRVSEHRHRMKLVSITLMLLGLLVFLGADTARLDTSSQFRKKWNKWALSRGKRELPASSSYPTGLADETTVPTQTLDPLQDEQNTTSTLQASNQSEAHIRVKRYRQSMNQGSRGNGCRFGTCTFQKLAHQIYQLTDKDKDGMAPRNKISPQGYGRRRRRSLPEGLRARTVESSQEQTHAAPAPWAHISRLFRI